MSAARPASLVALCALQLAFSLSWTVYVLFLPALAAQAGIAKAWVVGLLMLDQAIFAIMDWALGAHADRVAAVMKRLGGWLAGVSALSCAAFMALPFCAVPHAPWVLIVLIIVWALSASVLRAPALVLLARHASLDARPAIAAVYTLGLGLAAAVSPYVTLGLKGADPRWPFVVAGAATAAASLALCSLARGTADAGPARGSRLADPQGTGRFLLAALLLALGFQIHFALDAAPRWLAHVAPEQLPYWMPVFWIAFNLAVWPALAVFKRCAPLPAIAVAACAGALAALLAARAPTHMGLVVAELLAGAAWCFMALGTAAAALQLGATGREGSIAGRAFGLAALAVFARLAFTLSGVALDPAVRSIMQGTSACLWAVAALVLLSVARVRGAAARS